MLHVIIFNEIQEKVIMPLFCVLGLSVLVVALVSSVQHF